MPTSGYSVNVAQVDGRVTVSVNDHELSDYIEDFLQEECDFEIEWSSTVENEGGRIVHHCLVVGTPLEPVRRAISSLSTAELKRIWRLNN